MDIDVIETIFIEEAIDDHPTTRHILKSLPRAQLIAISRYQEIFNKRHQNFRLQKKNPCLILAKKHENFVLPAPAGFGMNSNLNFYFSHMYNCIYDCRYCFLQGMYSSAHYILFVNYEEFFKSISRTIEKYPDDSLTFFSGYDCDSLAFEKISNFANHTLDFFSDHPSIELELRTKSIVTSPLMKREPVRNCIVAFSLSPKKIANILDKKAPSISRRINALKQLAKAGWSVGLRFDPLIYCADWETMYSELIAEIMHDLNPRSLHSVSYGPLRFPKDMYKKIFTLHPNEKLFSFPMKEKAGIISYGTEIEDLMSKFIKNELNKYTSQNKIFRCAV